MDNVRTAKALYIGGRWLPAGSPVPLVQGFNYEKAARKGLIESTDGSEIVNPAAEGLPAAPEQAEQASDLQPRVTELEGQVATLTGERDRLQATLATAQTQATQTQQQLTDSQAKVRTLEALVKPEGEGTPLPTNFVGRGKLAAFGLETYESLQGKTAAQLNAIEGITPEQATKIVELVAAHFAKSE